MKAPPILRVLAVDPSPLQRRAALSLLSRQDLTVLVAADGPEALALVPVFRPHVLLTELILPGSSGLTLIRRCKLLSPSLKVLVITLSTGEWAVHSAYAAGADFVLTKPTDWEDVARLIRAMSGGLTARLEELFRTCGAPERWLGFHQCARCAALLSERRCLLLKEAYIQVAAEDHTSPANVSKNVERFLRELERRAGPSLPAVPQSPDCKDFLLALAQAVTFPL